MAEKRIGAFTPEEAREILSTVRWVQSSGIMKNAGQKKPNKELERLSIYVKNISGETAIPFACMQVVGVVQDGKRNFLEVDKPRDTISKAGHYVFNGFNEIEDGKFGSALADGVVRVASDETTFNAGDGFGPEKNSWKVVKGGDLLVAAGVDEVRDYVIKFLNHRPYHACLLQTPGGGIPARSGTTAGSADCTPYYIDTANSDTITEMTDEDGASQTLKIYNVAGLPVAGNVYIQAKRINGVLIVDMEDCG